MYAQEMICPKPPPEVMKKVRIEKKEKQKTKVTKKKVATNNNNDRRGDIMGVSKYQRTDNSLMAVSVLCYFFYSYIFIL